MGFGLWWDWECVVEHDVVDGVFFCYVFLIVQVVCVQPIVKISYCSIFVLSGVVGGVWDDRVCECGFSVYGGFPSCRGSVDSYVEVVQLLLVSSSFVNFRLGCNELKSCVMSCMFVWLRS